MATKKATTKKTTKKAPVPVKEEPKKEARPAKKRYFQGLGRRKTSVAQVRIYEVSEKTPKTGAIVINGKDYANYFPTAEMKEIVTAPLVALSLLEKFSMEVKVCGGGIRGQAEAVRMGLARALRVLDEKNTKTLRTLGYLTRDARKVERKKPGLKKARRAPQWQKR